MVVVKSVAIDGESIHVFRNGIYIFESSSGFTLELDLIVSEIVVKKYKNVENVIVEIELEDGRMINSIMHVKILTGGLPQINLFCELDDIHDYEGFSRVGENDSWFPNIEEGITIEEIRKVERIGPPERIHPCLTSTLSGFSYMWCAPAALPRRGAGCRCRPIPSAAACNRWRRPWVCACCSAPRASST